MLRVAEEALRRGHPDQAIIAYRKAVARFRLMGQRLKQMAVLQHLVRLQPDDLETLQELVDVYEELGRTRESAGARLRLATLLRQQGRSMEADRLEQKARAQAFALATERPRDRDEASVDETAGIREMPGDPVTPGHIEPQPPRDLHLDLDRPASGAPPGPRTASDNAAMDARPDDDDWRVAPSVRSRSRVRSRPASAATSRRPPTPPRRRDTPLSVGDGIGGGRATASNPAVDLWSFHDLDDDAFAGRDQATSATRVEDEGDRTEMFDVDATAAFVAGGGGDPFTADLARLDPPPSDESPFSPPPVDGFPTGHDQTLAMPVVEPNVPDRTPTPFGDETIARPADFGADNEEDTDAGPAPLPGALVEATVMESLPPALSEALRAPVDSDEPSPQEKTRAYDSEEIERLKALLDLP